jgi:hypothetical protein
VGFVFILHFSKRKEDGFLGGAEGGQPPEPSEPEPQISVPKGLNPSPAWRQGREGGDEVRV